LPPAPIDLSACIATKLFVNDSGDTAGAAAPLLVLDADADVDFELLEDDEPQPAITAAATNAGTRARFQTAIEVSPRYEGATTAPSGSLIFAPSRWPVERFHTAAGVSIHINGM